MAGLPACVHPDTPAARRACGYCAALIDATNTTDPLPIVSPEEGPES